MGVESQSIPALSYNSLRRFLPTLANVLGYGVEVAQAIGSWQEVPQGVGTSGQAIRPMSLHYSDARALDSCEAKRKVLEHFAQVSMAHPQVRSIVAGQWAQVPTGSFSWQNLAVMARGTSPQSSSSSSSAALPVALAPPSPWPMLEDKPAKKLRTRMKRRQSRRSRGTSKPSARHDHLPHV